MNIFAVIGAVVYVSLKRLNPHRFVAMTTIVVAMIVLAMPGISPAQKRGSTTKMRERKITGSITAVANGMFKVKSKHGDKEEWIVKPQGISNYLGSAPKEWLQPGTIVMVSSTFDKQGSASYPVAMLQAFTPRRGRVMGLVADPNNPGDPTDKSAPKAYLLAGPIKAIEDGNLKIAVGRKSFTVPMAEEVDVSVDLINDLSWVKAGDEIECKIKYVQPGQGFGVEMKISGKEVLEPRAAPLSKKERLAKARRDKAAAVAAAKQVDSVTKEAEATSGQAVRAADEN